MCTCHSLSPTLSLTQCSIHLFHSTRLSLQPLPRNIRKRADKFDGNINKRGNVPLGKAGDRPVEHQVSPWLIGMFMVLVIGSSVVSVLNLFGGKRTSEE